MNRSWLLLYLGLCLCTSCANSECVGAGKILEYTHVPKIIYLSDLTYQSDSLFSVFEDLSHRNRSYKYYICDCGDVRNFPIIYSHNLNKLPSVIKVSEDGLLSSVFPGDMDLVEWMKSSVMTDDMMDKFRCHHYMNNSSYNELEVFQNKFINLNDFYSCYLIFRLNAILNNLEEAEEYRERAINYYRNNPDPTKLLLFKELLASYNSEKPILVFDSLTIDIGELNEPGIYESIVKYKNFSPQPAIIIKAVISCSCIDISYDKIVPPYSEGVMRISYKVEGEKNNKDFERMIYLITNSQDEDIVIKLKGNY